MVGRREAEHLARHQNASADFGFPQHGVCLCGSQGERFFHQHVLACAQGGNRHGGMQIGGQADVYRIKGVEIAVRERRFHGAVFPDGGEIKTFPGIAQITLNGRQIARQFARV